jgi:hypothetical protein
MADNQTNTQRIQENIRRLKDQGQSDFAVESYLKSEGFTPTKFEAAVQSASKLGAAPIKSSFLGPLLQGLSFNTSDEIEAGMRALMQSGMSAFDAKQTMSGLITGQKPQSAYDQQLARVRAGIEEYSQQNPKTAIASEIAGGLIPLAATYLLTAGTGGAAAPAAVAQTARIGQLASSAATQLGKQALKGSAYGAGSGALSGFGAAKGDLGTRATGALIGAGTGAVLGAGIPLVTATGGAFVRKSSELAGANPISATEKAQELIARAINRSGMTPQQLANQQAMTVGRLGQRDETLADIGGESVRRLARGAMAIPSGSQDDVTQMLLQRAQGAGQRIGQDITDLTAIGPRSISDVADEIIANRSALASPKYQQAYDVGVVESDAINNLLKKSKDIQAAIADAKRLPDYADLPDNHMILLDKAYKYVGGMANEAKMKGSSERSRDLENLRVSFKDAITKKVPVYGEALNTFSSESLLKDALEAGSKNFMRKSPQEINKELSKFSDEGQREMYRLGAIEQLRNDIYNQKETADIASRYLSKGIMKDRLATVFNSPNEYEAFVKQLERERQMAITRSRIEGGSPTARIGQEIEEIQGASPGEIASAGAQLARGDFLGGAANLARQLGPRIQGLNQNVAEEVSRSLLNPSYLQNQQFLGTLTPVMDELQRRARAESARRAGYSTGAGMVVPGLLD